MFGSRPRRRTRASRLAMLAVAALISCLLTTLPASAAGTGSVSGVVTGPGGVPAEHAEVGFYMQPGDIIQPGWGALTDATGAYVVPDLPAGDYKVLFGFVIDSPLVSEWYDDTYDWASATLLHVADGSNITGIDAELAVGARVTGRLTTATGVGVHDGFVEAYRLGSSGYGLFTSAHTGPDGFYGFEEMPPGTYRMHFQDFTNNTEEFWNDKASLSAADDVVLTAGQERAGIDAVLGTPPPPLPAIVNTQPPKLGYQGSTAPQVGYPVKASRGYWIPGGVVVKDQWLVDGQPIPGATSDVYTPTLADLGRTLAVTATASQTGYVSATATSLPTNPVSKQVQNVKRPQLKGTTKVGRRLKVDTGSWRPLNVVTFRYRWYADGQRIRGARGDQLRLTPALKGTKIFCRVTGSAPGLDVLKVRTRSSARITR